jgi:hypothetical protein
MCPGLDADYSLPYSAEIKEDAIIVPTTPASLAAAIKHSDKFKFLFD